MVVCSVLVQTGLEEAGVDEEGRCCGWVLSVLLRCKLLCRRPV